MTDEPISTTPRKTLLKFYRATDIVAEEVQWLWYPYIPVGKLTMLEGDPGQGKSWISTWLAAAVSQGWALPGQREPLPPQKVLMLSAEDGLADTIKPRLQLLGANMDNIYLSDEFFTLDIQGIRKMENTMMEVSATLVFMDPLVAYMGGKVDMHKANEVRELVQGLAQAAARTHSAVVAIRHLRKAGGGKAIYRGIGSIDFTAAARSALLVDESKGGTRFMMQVKNNLAPKGPALAYILERDQFSWEGVFEDLDNENPSVNTTPRASAQSFLFEALKNGPVASVELIKQALDEGIPERTLQRAKKGLCHSKRVAGVWYWELDEREGIAHEPVSTRHSEGGDVAGQSPYRPEYTPDAQAVLLQQVGRGPPAGAVQPSGAGSVNGTGDTQPIVVDPIQKLVEEARARMAIRGIKS